ncbi:MAG TPA: hypothetical protein VMU14_09725 [Acidimicrobiales bacterium]|nr:hypothetical protein [Acidimicrobiales bacterium]
MPWEALAIVLSPACHGRGAVQSQAREASVVDSTPDISALGDAAADRAEPDQAVDLAAVDGPPDTSADGEGEASPMPDAAQADVADAAPDALPDANPREAGTLSEAGCFTGAADFPGPVCIGDGFCWQRPLPFGVTLNAVWAGAANDAWAVGAGGTFLHFDGKHWNLWPRASADLNTLSVSLNALFGLSPTDVWAAGQKGTVLHFDGTDWRLVAVPATSLTLRGIWASAPGDVWIVGDHQIRLRFDGASWTSERGTSAYTNFLAIWGSARNDVWAVGDGYEGTVEHFDGTAWTYGATDLESTASLQSVWGTGPNDTWATGGSLATEHWNGSSWRRKTPVPDTVGPTSLIGRASDDIWLIDPYHTSHWDGASWTAVAALDRSDLVAGWLDPCGDGWAVGVGGRLARKSGADWSFLGGAVVPDQAMLLGVWAPADNDVWAVGMATTVHWDGTSWTKVAPAPTKYSQELSGVWGSGPNDVWTVGWGDFPNNVQHWDGSSWTVPSLPSYGDSDMNAVWGTARDDVWMVGYGTVIHYDGSQYTYPSPSFGVSSTMLWDVHGTAADDVWIAGEGGALAHLTSAGWTKVTSGTTNDLRCVFAFAPNDVWFGGTGVLRRWDGSSLSEIPLPSAVTGVVRIAGSSSSDAWIATDGQQVYHYDGSSWRLSATVGITLTGLARTPSGALIVVGDNGGILRRSAK